MKTEPVQSIEAKAAEQRAAAARAVDRLATALGPDLTAFAAEIEEASFRFGAALRSRVAPAPASEGSR
jgi:hypothetical protein